MPTKKGEARKYIEDRHKMWELFLEFCNEKKRTPFLVKDWVGKDGDLVHREKERPLSFDGFRVWLAMKDVTTNLKEYAANKDGVYDEYKDVIDLIRDVCKVDMVDGAMAGIYNGNLAARINSITEKTDNTNVNINRNITVEVIDTGVKPATSESEIKLD